MPVQTVHSWINVFINVSIIHYVDTIVFFYKRIVFSLQNIATLINSNALMEPVSTASSVAIETRTALTTLMNTTAVSTFTY